MMPHHPSAPSAEQAGTHNMLVVGSKTVYLSHLPMFHGEHAAQVILEANFQQSNKNLLLSDSARVDTKPQLEIFNDDVKCSHGATVGQLEDEELFYLLARGLPTDLAKNLLTYGFAEEVINKIGIDEIKSELDAMVMNRLGTEI